MTQPDPSDRLTSAARTLLDYVTPINDNPEAPPEALKSWADMRADFAARLLEVQAEARADAAAQTAAAVKALRKAHEKVCDCDFNDCDLSDTIRDLDAAAKQHDEAVAERAVRLYKDTLEDHLAAIYAPDKDHSRVVIARLCDERLDRSGALLGRVRAKARALLAQAPSSGSEEQERG